MSTIKFQPEMFRQGTVFEINESVGVRPCKWVTTGEGEETETTQVTDYDAPRQFQFVAKEVRRNGHDSYVVETMTPHDSIAFTQPMNHSFHISHIERIVKGGTGPLKISYIQWGDPQTVFREHGRLQEEFSHYKNRKLPSTKTHYVTYALEMLVTYLIFRFKAPGHYVVNSDLMRRKLVEQSFCKVLMDGPHFHIHALPKKRVNAWLKANLNRFLESPRKAQDEYDKAMAEIMDRDFDRDDGPFSYMLDDDDGVSPGPARAEFESDWTRGEQAFQNGVSADDLENSLSEDHAAGLITSERADNVRYGYDSERMKAMNKAEDEGLSHYDRDEYRRPDYYTSDLPSVQHADDEADDTSFALQEPDNVVADLSIKEQSMKYASSELPETSPVVTQPEADTAAGN